MKSVISVIMAFFIMGTSVFSQGTADVPLERMAAFAEGEGFEVSEWSITIKEAFDREDLSQIKEEIVSFLPQANVSYDETLEASRVVVSNGQKKANHVEKFIIIIPNKKGHQAQLVYTLGSLGTPSLVSKNIMNDVDRVKTRFFSDDVIIYSCLMAKSSGIINDVLVYQNFKEVFNITTIEKVKEDGWTSRSGYTEQWGDPIPLASDHMNVQFATRTLGGKTNITIGTPIITTEY